MGSDPQRWQQVQEVFLQALDLGTGERPAFLAEACAGAGDLRRRVESMLAAAEQADRRIEGTIEGVLRLAGAEEEPETRHKIGPYEVIREIGRGGLSTVYLARRADEQYRMDVAVKVIRRGLDTQDIVDRLRQERQILANLDHPSIARLLDGGTTEDGLPYVVMEAIDGEHVDEYCQRHQLTTTQRLKLFLEVCSAVQYAHQNLVIHRDIKPGNILVTRDGVAKLLDFGLAKLLDPALVPHTVPRTATQVRLLTPEYASPEQIRGEVLTTATDVYSLGVLLYLLLSGSPPYRLAAHHARELERVICDTEPPKPSAAEATPERLRWRLQGDLDNIVLTALAKQPQERYASVEQLAEDLRRYLEARPVMARKPTLRYRCLKFLRRHRAATMAAALVAASLVAGMTTTVWQARRAEAERARAERNLARAEVQQARAEHVSEFLIGLFEVSDPYETLGESITAREILDRGADNIARELEESPEVRAALASTLGRVYQNMGLFSEAQPLLEQALELRRRTLGDPHMGVARSLVDLASLRNRQADFAAAESLAREAITVLEQLPEQEAAAGRAAGLHRLAMALHGRGELEAARKAFRQALELRRGEDDPLGQAEISNDLGELLYELHELGAEELFRQALETRRRRLPAEHPDVTTSLGNLAAVLDARGRYPDAEILLREVLEIRRKVFGGTHPSVAVTLNNLAEVLLVQGKLEEAEPLFREALDMNREIWGGTHLDVAINLNSLAGLLEAKGDLDGAERLYREALVMKRRVLGEKNEDVALSRHRLAGLLETRGRLEEAEAESRAALDLLREVLPPGDVRLSYPLVRLSRLLTARGRPGEAVPLLEEALDLRRAVLAPEDRRIVEAEEALRDSRAAARRPPP